MDLVHKIRNVLTWVLYPKCLVCGKEVEPGTVFCSQCFAHVTFVDFPVCKICGKMMESSVVDGLICDTCNTFKRHFDVARSLLQHDYNSSRLLRKIKAFSDEHAAAVCAELLFSKYLSLFDEVDMIIPVPSHWTRLLKRGYNPAGVIAGELSKVSGIPLRYPLKKARKTEFQVGKTMFDRINNVNGAFKCGADLSGKSIILVDDVLTTGATLNECARILRQAGARKVACITVATTKVLHAEVLNQKIK